MSSLDNSMPLKAKKRRNCAVDFKRAAIEYAEKNSNHKAEEKFCVAVKRIRKLRQNSLKIFEPTFKPNNKRLEGGGRKTTRPIIRKPIGLMNLRKEIQWIGCLEKTYHRQGEIF